MRQVKKEFEKICTVCGKSFIAKSSKAKYCSYDCAKQNTINKAKINTDKKYPLEKECAICGTKFLVNAVTHSQKFCSDACRLQSKENSSYKSYIKRVLSDAFDEQSQEGYDYIICPICGEKHKQITLTHFRRHGFKTTAEIKEKFPDFKMTCPKQINENLIGNNNPTTKLTPEQRQQNSPNNIQHYLKKFNGDMIKAHNALEQYREKVHKKQKTAIQGTNTLYYTRQGYTEEEAQQIIHDKYATNGLDRYIKKYGKIEGEKKYKDRIERWAASALKGLTHSHVSDKCIQEIIGNYDNPNIFYGDNEYTIFSPLTNIHYKVDLINLTNNTIIEFFGDYWHCNPHKYTADFFNKNSKKTAEIIWDYDRKKIKALESLNYKVMIIWEHDYRNNHDTVIKNAQQFLFNINNGNKEK